MWCDIDQQQESGGKLADEYFVLATDHDRIVSALQSQLEAATRDAERLRGYAGHKYTCDYLKIPCPETLAAGRRRSSHATADWTPPARGMPMELELPPWPEEIRTDGAYEIYKGMRYCHFEETGVAQALRSKDLIEALRARLALAVEFIGDVQGFDWLERADYDEMATAIIDASKEPS